MEADIVLTEADDPLVLTAKGTAKQPTAGSCQQITTLLKEVYVTHVQALSDLQQSYDEMCKKNKRLEKQKTEAVQKGREIQKQYATLQSDMIQTKEELKAAKATLSGPCQTCTLLRGQLEQQEKLYHVVCDLVKAGTTDRRELLALAQGTLRSQREEPVTPSGTAPNQQEPLQRLLEKDPLRDDAGEGGRRDAAPLIQQPPGDSSPGGVGGGTGDGGGARISPSTGRARSLKLDKGAKRARCKYTEAPLVEDRKRKASLSPGADGDQKSRDPPCHLKKQRSAPPSGDAENRRATGILAPDTCDPNFDLDLDDDRQPGPRKLAARGAAGRRGDKTRRPNIIVPETVPFCLTSSEEEEDPTGSPHHRDARGPEKSGDSSRHKATSGGELDGPPADSCHDMGEIILHSDGAYIAAPHVIETGPGVANVGAVRPLPVAPPGGRRNSTLSLPDSPVFGRSKTIPLAQNPKSPSLFEEEGDESDGATRDHVSDPDDPGDGQGYASPRRDRTVDVSMGPDERSLNMSESPSVLSGRSKKSTLGQQKPERSRDLRADGGRAGHVLGDGGSHGDKQNGAGRSSEKDPDEKSKSSSLGFTPQETFPESRRKSTATKAGKKLVQSTISMSQLTRGARQGNQAVGRDDEAAMLESARQASLRLYQQEVLARAMSTADSGPEVVEVFTQPQMTSTPCPGKARQREEDLFKKPSSTEKYKLYHRLQRERMRHRDAVAVEEGTRVSGNEGENHREGGTRVGDQSNLEKGTDDLGQSELLNGSIDPGVRLSQYDTPLERSGVMVFEAWEPGVWRERPDVPSVEAREPGVSPERPDVTIIEAWEPGVSRERPDVTSIEAREPGISRGRPDATIIEACEPGVSQNHTKDASSPSTGSHSTSGRLTRSSLRRSRKTAPAPDGADADILPLGGADAGGNTEESHVFDGRKVGSPNDVIVCTDDAALDDSFDVVPRKKTGPDYAYVDVVRKRAERQKLTSFPCRDCEKYYTGMDLSEAELQERIKNCRHKARFGLPSTPEHYWSLGFPDTQEIQERGYMDVTQAKPSEFRRRRKLKALFTTGAAEDESEGEDPDVDN